MTEQPTHRREDPIPCPLNGDGATVRYNCKAALREHPVDYTHERK